MIVLILNEVILPNLLFLNCRGLPLTKQTLSCVNLTCSRGESRAVEVVLFHFIIPAVCHILSCTHTQDKVELQLKGQSNQSCVVHIYQKCKTAV